MSTIAATHPLRRWIDRIYGPAVFAKPTPPSRVLHVTALARDGDGLATIRIGPRAPRSPHDWFALQFARARADAIVVTGQLLRDEPHLDFTLRGPVSSALSKYRHTDLGKSRPPKILLLTRGQGLPWDHPLLTSSQLEVLTHAQGASEIERATRGQRSAPTTHVLDAPSLASGLAFAHAELGAACVSIEAGPATSRHAYEGEGLVDELLLSIYEGTRLDDKLLTRVPFAASTLAAQLPHATPPRRVEELSGPWRFERRTRRA